MFEFRRIGLFAILCCTILLTSASYSFAADGDGTGGGSGENRDILLTLESTSIKDGATDISVNEIIQLDFNKNVCNILVLPTNKKSFHLTDSRGTAVAISLTFPDDQVQHTYKNQVFVSPVQPLEKNTEYRISVDRTLTAKNGTTIDNAYSFTFTTGQSEMDSENSVLKRLGDNIVVFETAYGETADSVPVDKSGLQDSQDQGFSTTSIARIAAIVLILIVVAFTVIFIVLKRKRE